MFNKTTKVKLDLRVEQALKSELITEAKKHNYPSLSSYVIHLIKRRKLLMKTLIIVVLITLATSTQAEVIYQNGVRYDLAYGAGNSGAVITPSPGITSVYSTSPSGRTTSGYVISEPDISYPAPIQIKPIMPNNNLMDAVQNQLIMDMLR